MAVQAQPLPLLSLHDPLHAEDENQPPLKRKKILYYINHLSNQPSFKNQNAHQIHRVNGPKNQNLKENTNEGKKSTNDGVEIVGARSANESSDVFIVKVTQPRSAKRKNFGSDVILISDIVRYLLRFLVKPSDFVSLCLLCKRIWTVANTEQITEQMKNHFARDQIRNDSYANQLFTRRLLPNETPHEYVDYHLSDDECKDEEFVNKLPSTKEALDAWKAKRLLAHHCSAWNGLKHGQEFWKDRKGNLSFYQTWFQGKRHGPEEHYYASGRKRKSSFWKNHIMVGEETEYYDMENSPISYQCHRDDEGRKDGLQIFYWKDQSIYRLCYYKAGLKHNKEEEYYENGKLQHQISWANGSQEGLETTWYPSGSMQRQKHYRQGRRNGVQFDWYDGGQLQRKTCWKDDNMWGKQSLYATNGQKLYTCIFEEEGRTDEEAWSAEGFPCDPIYQRIYFDDLSNRQRFFQE